MNDTSCNDNGMTIIDLTTVTNEAINIIRFAPSTMTATAPMVCRFNAGDGSRESSNMYAAGYVLTAGGGRYLWLRFKGRDAQPSNDVYVYVGATVGLFYGLLVADSAGKYVAQNVRPLPFVKLSVEVGGEFDAVAAQIAAMNSEVGQ